MRTNKEATRVGFGWDDEQLLEGLRLSLADVRDVPPEFIAAARNAYAWRNVDAELAQLSYDSSRDLALRQESETAAARAPTSAASSAALALAMMPVMVWAGVPTGPLAR